LDGKLLAFRALQRGLKFAYENWRMWVNYMIIAMEVGELSEATRALGTIVEQRADKEKEKCVDIEVLESLVNECGKTSREEGDGTTTETRYSKPNEGRALTRRVLDLIERQILPRISSSSRIFRAYARLLVSQSRYSDALEAHMNAFRLTTAGGGKNESISTREEWREAVVDVEEIIDVLRNLGPKTVEEQKLLSSKDDSGDGEEEKFTDKDVNTNRKSSLITKNWSLQARSILRSFMGRTRRDFEDEPEFSKLEELMEEIRDERYPLPLSKRYAEMLTI
jgi:hypothetical protein